MVFDPLKIKDKLKNLKPDRIDFKGPMGLINLGWDTHRSGLDKYKGEKVRVTKSTGEVAQGTFLSSDTRGIYLKDALEKEIFIPVNTLASIEPV